MIHALATLCLSLQLTDALAVLGVTARTGVPAFAGMTVSTRNTVGPSQAARLRRRARHTSLATSAAPTLRRAGAWPRRTLATPPMMSSPPIIVFQPTVSSRTSQPRKTATTGMT